MTDSEDDFSAEAAGSPDDAALDQDEIDGIFAIGKDGEPPSTGFGALLNRACIQHNRMPLLEACFDRLVRTLSSAMRSFTGNNVELKLLDSTSVRFGDYIESIPLPALISVFKAAEWNGYGLINVDSPLIYSIIDVLLGGRQGTPALPVEGRAFTSIESSLIERLIRLVLKEMSATFSEVSQVAFRHERLEANPSLATIVHPTSTAILFGIDVGMEERGGRIEVLFPYATLEPVRSILQQMFMGEKFGRDRIWERHWAREMLHADAELEVTLGRGTITLAELVALEVGSTLELACRPRDPVTMTCGDIPLFQGRIGRVGDQMAVRIEDWIRKGR